MVRYQDSADSLPIRIPDKIPVFPLPNVLLFPGVDLPLYIFEPRYRKMLADCIAGNKFIGISLFKPGWEARKEPIPSYSVIGVGYVRAMFENPDGTSHILLKGTGRVQIARYVQWEPYRVARVREMPDQIEDVEELPRLAAKLKKLLLLKLRFTSENPRRYFNFPKEFKNPITLSHLACFFTDANPYLKQDLLETAGCNSRMKHLIDIFEQEIHPSATRN